jgi:hypothetical protein
MKYERSPLPKSALYLEALPHFNRGAVAIPNHERLLRELRGLERRVHRSGKDTVDHGAHGSDDHANSVCGAMYVAFREVRKPKMWQGAIDVDGFCHYRDTEPRSHSRITWMTVNELGEVIRK